MLSLTIRRKHWVAAWTLLLAAALVALAAVIALRNTPISAQDFPAIIGRIEGDDLEVATTTPAGIEKDAAPTIVATGSDVTLRSGHALVLLNGGGEISVCGPAHFKLIKSSGAVTLALDYGRVHPSLDTADGFTIYTPTIVATPIAISGGRRDLTVGLEPDGEMCVLTARGAMRVEPQFSDQSMIIPQGGTVSLSGGQVNSLQADVSACSCDYPRSRIEPVRPALSQHPQSPAAEQPGEVATLAPPSAPKSRRTQNAAPPSAASGEPVYTVLMPPLSFNANSPEPPPDPSPETIVLVRQVRLRPTFEYRGHVNPAPTQAAAPLAATPPTVPAPSQEQPPPQPGLIDRVRNFFRKLTSTNDSPCAGAGCSG